MNFEGTYVAMITPFTENKEIDEEGFRSNINFLIEKGVKGLLGAGTTGESATMNHEEHKKVVDILIDEVDGKVETIVGSGSNSTEEAITLTQYADDVGADAALVITPYYNKPQQHALINHYKILTDATDIPIIAYSVPSRTGVNIEPETVVELAKIEGMEAIKEASGSVSKISTIYTLLRKEGLEDDFNILSGEDGLTLPMIALGATGVISASANVDPTRMVLMVDSMLNGDYDGALKYHYEMIDLINALFIETNPVPVKTAMGLMGLPSGPLREPLAPMLDENLKVLKKALKDSNINL